jgi:hypothetical protein
MCLNRLSATWRESIYSPLHMQIYAQLIVRLVQRNDHRCYILHAFENLLFDLLDLLLVVDLEFELLTFML